MRSGHVYVLPTPPKSPSPTLQFMLRTLFPLTPFKFVSVAPDDPQKQMREELLKPGALCVEASIHTAATLVPPAEENMDDGGMGKVQAVV